MWPVWLEPRQRGREGQVRVNSSVLVLGSPLQRRELEDPWRNGRPSIRSRNHQGLCPEFPSVMSAHSGPSRDLERLPGAPCMPRQPWAGPRLCYSPPLSSCHPRSQICHFLGSPGHSPSFRVGHCPRRVHLCPALHPQGPPAGLSSVGGTGLHQAPGAEPESGPQPSPAQPLSPTPAPALPSACAGSPTASRCWPPGAPRCPPPRLSVMAPGMRFVYLRWKRAGAASLGRRVPPVRTGGRHQAGSSRQQAGSLHMSSRPSDGEEHPPGRAGFLQLP